MLVIKGNEMPKSCSECPFKANDYVCGLLDCAFSCHYFKERNYNCPLMEIVTCKDCKHLCHIEDVPKVLVCGKHNCQQVSRNFYCADGERREK